MWHMLDSKKCQGVCVYRLYKVAHLGQAQQAHELVLILTTRQCVLFSKSCVCAKFLERPKPHLMSVERSERPHLGQAQQAHKLVLRRIGVLELVHQQPSVAPPEPGGQLPVSQQSHHQRQQVVKVQHIAAAGQRKDVNRVQENTCTRELSGCQLPIQQQRHHQRQEIVEIQHVAARRAEGRLPAMLVLSFLIPVCYVLHPTEAHMKRTAISGQKRPHLARSCFSYHSSASMVSSRAVASSNTVSPAQKIRNKIRNSS